MLYVARILWCQTNILVSMNTLLTAHFRCHPLQIPTLWNKYFSRKLRISSQPPQKSSGDSVLALSLSSVLLLILSSVFYPLPLFFFNYFFSFFVSHSHKISRSLYLFLALLLLVLDFNDTHHIFIQVVVMAQNQQRVSWFKSQKKRAAWDAKIPCILRA
jgi:hypothetical protein